MDKTGTSFFMTAEGAQKKEVARGNFFFNLTKLSMKKFRSYCNSTKVRQRIVNDW